MLERKESKKEKKKEKRNQRERLSCRNGIYEEQNGMEWEWGWEGKDKRELIVVERKLGFF